MHAKAHDKADRFLSFVIANEEYAIGILRVREITEFGTLTRVPAAPASVRGVINLRGSVVPVIDLAVRFGLPESQTTNRTCVIVVETGTAGDHSVMGILADRVCQVMDLDSGQIEPPPSFGMAVRPEFLLGMGAAGNKFVLLLDIDKLLSIGEINTLAGELDGAADFVTSV